MKKEKKRLMTCAIWLVWNSPTLIDLTFAAHSLTLMIINFQYKKIVYSSIKFSFTFMISPFSNFNFEKVDSFLIFCYSCCWNNWFSMKWQKINWYLNRLSLFFVLIDTPDSQILVFLDKISTNTVSFPNRKKTRHLVMLLLACFLAKKNHQEEITIKK